MEDHDNKSSPIPSSDYRVCLLQEVGTATVFCVLQATVTRDKGSILREEPPLYV